MKSLSAETIFFEALDKSDPAERVAFVKRACGKDVALRERVEKLLAAYPDVGGFLDEPLVAREGSVDAPLFHEVPAARIGPYKLLQQIGEGGFGVVYMAEQVHPVRRNVALKIIKPGADTRSVVARFEAERQALALMDHPNIARVLDGGATERGRPYFVMELVNGVPITEYCDRNRLGTHDRLALFVAVCRAVQHAHQKGVIHRDLKPANIMVTLHDGIPVPKVIDFGVSKAIKQQLTEKTLFTAYGQMVGTPQYMSPEQAEMSGLDLDTRTDIYSLGVLLYELLTGHTPLDARRLRMAGYAETQRMICDEEALKPSRRLSTLGDELTVIAKHRSIEPKRLRQLVRGDLDWIVMKALEKERSRRYDSASRLADDIHRFLADEAVEARPPSAFYKCHKFVRRHKRVVVAASAVSVALLAGIVGTTIGLIRAEHAAGVASAQASRANRLARDAVEAETRATHETHRYRRLLYMADMNVAYQAWKTANIDLAVNLLRRHMPRGEEEDLRHFEWYYLFRLCQRNLRTPTINGGWNVACSSDGTLATSLHNRVALYNIENRATSMLDGHEQEIQHLQFSADGKILATCSNTELKLWDAAEREEIATIDAPTAGAEFVALSPDAKLVAWGGWGMLRVRAVDGMRQRWTMEGVFDAAAFSPNSRLLATGGRDGVVLRNAETGEYLHKFEGHVGVVTCIAFSPDGKALASGGGDQTVRVWDLETRRLRQTLEGHDGNIVSVMFSNDGSRLASGCQDNTARLWNPHSGEHLDTFPGSTMSVAFLPDDTVLAVGGKGRTKLWNLDTAPIPDVLHGHTDGVTGADFSPDGRLLASCGWDGAICLWNLATGAKSTIQAHKKRPIALDFSPDGTTLASGGYNDSIKFWDTQTLALLHTLDGHSGQVWSVEFSNDCERIITNGDDGEVRVWNVKSREQLARRRYQKEVMMATFAPDGQTVAIACRDQTVKLWKWKTDQIRTLADNVPQVWSVRFSPDGKMVAVTSGTRIRLFDALTGAERDALEGHTELVTDVAFAPARSTVATCGYDGTLKLWNPLNGTERFTIYDRFGGVNWLTFSPDGTILAVCGRDTTVRLLRAATEQDVREAGWYEDAR